MELVPAAANGGHAKTLDEGEGGYLSSFISSAHNRGLEASADQVFRSPDGTSAYRLTFRLVDTAGVNVVNSVTALRLIRRGAAPCAITGAALTALAGSPHHLQLTDLLLRKACVFSRMLPESKRLLVELISAPVPDEASGGTWWQRFQNRLKQVVCFWRANTSPPGLPYTRANTSPHPPTSHGRRGPRGSASSRVASSDSRPALGLGMGVAFCGDGANDMPALRASLVSMSIGGASGSMAAGFATPASRGLHGLLDVLKEGRASAAMSLTIFQHIIACTWVQLFSTTFLYKFGLTLTSYQYLYQDLIFVTLTAFAMGLSTPLPTLSREKQGVKVLSARTLAPVVVQWALAAGFVAGSYGMLHAQPWFTALGKPFECWGQGSEDEPSTTEAGTHSHADALASTSSGDSGSAGARLPTAESVTAAARCEGLLFDYEDPPYLEDKYSSSRPEPAVIFIMGVTLMLGGSIVFSTDACGGKGWRQAARRNWVLMGLWAVEVSVCGSGGGQSLLGCRASSCQCPPAHNLLHSLHALLLCDACVHQALQHLLTPLRSPLVACSLDSSCT